MIPDEILSLATEVEGFRVLPPCVLYAKLGQGGMGAVYRGRHLNLDIDVAVKCLKPGLASEDGQYVERFQWEARSAAVISHPNVIRVYDVAEDRGLHYLIMEFVQGETARQRVVRKGRLSLGEASQIVLRAAQGLAEAHRLGVIHRDIKPDNILISTKGEVKVADLGLAKPNWRGNASSPALSMANAAMGTPEYMPPEQWDDASSVTAAADVWALGATYYFLLVGEEAIARDSYPRMMKKLLAGFPDPRLRRDDVPDDVAALVARATATEPLQRFRNAEEFAEAIEHLTIPRVSLRDDHATNSAARGAALPTPPPSRTLAKIRSWLNDHGKDVPTLLEGLRTQPEPPRDDPEVVGTRVATPPVVDTQPNAPPRRRPATAALLLLVAGLAAGGYFAWTALKETSSPGVFTRTNELAAARRWGEAILEAERVHKEDASLQGRAERVAGYQANWALDLEQQGELDEALGQCERSLQTAPLPAAEHQRNQLLARIQARVEQRLERLRPGTQKVPRAAKVVFAGALIDNMVQAVLLAGQPVEWQNGVFEAERTIDAEQQITVEVLLKRGQKLVLRPWRVEFLALDQVPLSVPDELALLATGPTDLLITAAAGAHLTIEGLPPIDVPADQTEIKVPVPASLLAQGKLMVQASKAGFADTRAEVRLVRAIPDLHFVTQPQAESPAITTGEGAYATDEATVSLQFALDGIPQRVVVDGKQLPPTDSTLVTTVVPLQPGPNTISIRVEGRPNQPLEGKLLVERVDRIEALQVVAPTKVRDTTERDRYEVVVRGSAWLASVHVEYATNTLTMTRDPTEPNVHRATVPLAIGDNEITVAALTRFTKPQSLLLSVTRRPPPEPPSLSALVLVDEAGVERPVTTAGTNFARTRQWALRAKGSPNSELLVDDQPPRGLVTPDTFRLGDYVGGATSSLRICLRRDNLLSQPIAVVIGLDATPPQIHEQAPTTPVAAGAEFVASGRWVDVNGLAHAAVGNRTVQVTCDPGCTDRGRWEVALMAPTAGPALFSLVVRDSLGNEGPHKLEYQVHANSGALAEADANQPTSPSRSPDPKGLKAKEGTNWNAAGYPEVYVHVASGIELVAVPFGAARPQFYAGLTEVTEQQYSGEGGTNPVVSIQFPEVTAWLAGPRGLGLQLPTDREWEAMRAEGDRLRNVVGGAGGVGEWLVDRVDDKLKRAVRTRNGQADSQTMRQQMPFLGFRTIYRL